MLHCPDDWLYYCRVVYSLILVVILHTVPSNLATTSTSWAPSVVFVAAAVAVLLVLDAVVAVAVAVAHAAVVGVVVGVVVVVIVIVDATRGNFFVQA